MSSGTSTGSFTLGSRNRRSAPSSRGTRILRSCDQCGEEYSVRVAEIKRGWGRYCSKSCSTKSRPRQRRVWPSSRVWFHTCRECGELFTARHGGIWICGEECRRRRLNRQTSESIMRRYYRDSEFKEQVVATAQMRRATHLGLGGQLITMKYLIERDGGRCGLCGEVVRQGDESMDHIVPLSLGGEHVLSNVHLAHRSCNYSKGNRGSGEQLLLVG